MLRPLLDIADPALMAKLGREYTLKEAWRDAVSQLRDSVTALNSDHPDALDHACEAVERLKQIKAHREAV